MEKKNFTAASVFVAMLVASGHFAPADASENAGPSLQTMETGATGNMSENIQKPE
ncbi:MAG: hypothetical protein MR698_05765 [Selenomonas sp.]|nr:hypothetical protein [Selenomonas sp.]